MAKENESIITYARTCFSSFDEVPFNAIDATICSQLAYLSLREEFDNTYSSAGMPVWKLLRAEDFPSMLGGPTNKPEILDLLFAFAANPRYRDARIKYYRAEFIPSISLQFSAVVYTFQNDMHFVGFRGTDNTLTGWKEDLLLVAKKAASSQMMAVNYLNGVGKKLSGRLYLGGHSKGGILASYSAAHCEPAIRDRIAQIFNLDGPGFPQVELQLPGMAAIRDRVTKIIASPVGMLMRSETEPIVIQTTASGLHQHHTYNWVVDGHTFQPLKDPDKRSMKLIRRINAWAETVSDSEVNLFAQALFGMLETTSINDFAEILGSPASAALAIRKAFRNTDDEKRRAMIRVLKEVLTGKAPLVSNSDQEDEEDFGIDWNRVERLMNDFETEQFAKDYDLFL